MKENKYDDPQFFEKYSHMARSEQGLEGAGEWYALQKMLPDFSGKRVLDLGCGYGRHCRYIDFPPASFDLVLSSLAFHYIADYPALCRKVEQCLAPGGDFVFSVEHPVFTAYGNQDWYYGSQGEILHWPVDHYYEEGRRQAVFLGEPVTKYHRTVTTYVQTLLQLGFVITGLVEPQPTPEAVEQIPGMADEMRRPMMLLVAAHKPAGGRQTKG